MQTKRFVLIWLAFTAVASAQNYYPKKDAAFGQVVVGGGYETVINLTNRGTHSYVGTLGLFRTVNNESVDWNPTIDGVAVENGKYGVEIQPQATLTLRLTGSQLESGAAMLLSENFFLDNLIEANLTYLIIEGGQVSDSVGIAPSKEFFRASIPFEKFSEIALALANGDLSGERTAKVELSLFSRDGNSSGPKKTITLGSLIHSAKFLHEHFPRPPLDGGKVEIASDSPIFGTALTFSGGQFSSLPLDPAPVTYSVRLVSQQGSTATGELILWAEGFFVRGYLVFATVDGEAYSEEPFLHVVNGELALSQFRLAFTVFDDPFHGEEVAFSLRHDDFSFEKPLVAGTFTETFREPYGVLTGNFELTRSDEP